jgi:nucleolar protein 56
VSSFFAVGRKRTIMSDPSGWFAGLDPDDTAAAAEEIRTGTAERAEAWPRLAVEAGFADSEDEYYDRLRSATLRAARAAVTERERADDQQLVHTVRAMDDCLRTANELAERVTEWSHSRHPDDDGSGLAYARELADRAPEDELGEEVLALAEEVVVLDERAASLRETIERTMPAVAPNLTALAGPVLGARLIALSGGLEPLAKSTSGTVQVLGAEEALFAHLRGSAPSPKHGVIYTHEYVRGTDPEERGSAARALAGKLTIAARVDHYGGERKPEIDAELDERIARIRSRGGE